MNKQPHSKSFTQSTNFGTLGDNYVVIMVGLPCRGKSYTARKLAWYLYFVHGCQCKIFTLSDYRQKLYPNFNNSHFDSDNVEGLKMREKCAEIALDELKLFMDNKNNLGIVGILDGTNSTLERRSWIMSRFKNVKIIFIENIITDKELEKNYILNKLETDDLKEKNTFDKFYKRINYYKKKYKTLEEDNYSWIKVINAGSQIILNKIRGYLSSKIASFVSALKINNEKIYLSRHGESEYNSMKLIGGDSKLTPKGIKYAKELSNWIKNQQLDLPQKKTRLWISTMKRTSQTIQFFPNKIVEGWEILRPKKWGCLDEIHAGQMDGFSYQQIKELYPQEYLLRKKNKLKYRYPGGESYLDLINRLEPVFLEIEGSSYPVIIIAHNAVIRIIYSYLMQIKREESVHLEFQLNTLREVEPRNLNCKVKMFKL